MSATRAITILSGVFAAAAAMQAGRADADFLRIQPACVTSGDGWTIVSSGFSGDSACGESGLNGFAVPGPIRSERPFERPGDERDLAWLLWNCHVLPGNGAGASGAGQSSAGGGGPGGQAALAPLVCQLPQRMLLGCLPGERNPSFDNPPPWTPLRPPRAAAA